MSFSDVIFEGLARRKEALDEARCAGRLGATRLPLALSSNASLSDTLIGKCQIALLVGREQRTANDEYSLWLAANAARLAAEVIESGAQDGAAWLQQQYRIETGREP